MFDSIWMVRPGVTPVGDRRRQFVDEHQLPLRLRQEHDAAVGTHVAAVERRRHLLAANGWKCERRNRIVVMAGVALLQVGKGLASTTESYAASAHYAALANLTNTPS
jgi:hypothetical protein